MTRLWITMFMWNNINPWVIMRRLTEILKQDCEDEIKSEYQNLNLVTKMSDSGIPNIFEKLSSLSQ